VQEQIASLPPGRSLLQPPFRRQKKKQDWMPQISIDCPKPVAETVSEVN
jgi:hypothetical protein